MIIEYLPAVRLGRASPCRRETRDFITACVRNARRRSRLPLARADVKKYGFGHLRRYRHKYAEAVGTALKAVGAALFLPLGPGLVTF